MAGTPAVGATQDDAPDSIICGSCAIDADPIIRLGDIADSTHWSGITRVARGPADSLFLSSLEGGYILVYPPEGGAVARTIGRKGEGPGEFQEPDRIVFIGDSLFVFDRRSPDVTVFGPGRTLARETRLDPPFSIDAVFAAPAGEGIVVHGWVREPDAERLPIHVLSREGRLQASFGDLNPPADPRAPRTRRKIGPSPDGAVWSVPISGGYLIEKWSMDGARMNSLRFAPAWLAEADAQRPAPGEVGERPLSAITQPIRAGQAQFIWEDDDGRVWVGHTVVGDGSERFPTPEHYRTMVEVIDPEARRVMSRHVIDGLILDRVIGSADLVFGKFNDEATGMEYIQVWRLSMRERR